MGTILTIVSFGFNDDLPQLPLTITTYDGTVTTVEYDTSLNRVDSIQRKILEGYEDQFKSLNQERSKLETIESGMIDYFLKISSMFLAKTNRKYLFGASIGSSNITVWFNNQGYHTLPISLGLLHNAALRAVVGREVSMSVTNKPLPYRAESKASFLEDHISLSNQLPLNLSYGLAFVSAFFVVLYVRERESKAKLLQLISGIYIVLYWITAFVWDYLQFIVLALILTATIGVFRIDGYSSFAELSRVYFTLLVFGFSVLPIIYCTSLLFNDAASGFMKLVIVFLFCGTAMFLITSILDQFKMTSISKPLEDTAMIVPHFAVTKAFNQIFFLNEQLDACGKLCSQRGICGEEQQCSTYARCCGEEI
jgi:ATP-binding cassette, subfamily A (ABC1), member 3